ncbi:alpha/beta hydrolase [Gryllotalpicola reticulitermitis]|uniref:Alpha/beta hydrolase n=1 Tax=Gryllotalpicola reticulitermitis TaxID=1184153 RepID=A0ABV8Q962_9MICO
MFRRMIYHPAGTRRAAKPDDVVLDRGRIQLRGVQVNPGRKRGLVYFGGNAENSEVWASAFGAAFPEHTIYLFAYRGYGASNGRPTQRGIVADSVALHQLVAQNHPEQRVDVIGRSLGSGVAVQLAARVALRHLVLVTPFESTLGFASGIPPWIAGLLISDHWNSASAVTKVSCPTLVLRAGNDATVVPARTDALLTAAPFATVRSFPAADHGSIAREDDYLPTIAAFLAN